MGCQVQVRPHGVFPSHTKSNLLSTFLFSFIIAVENNGLLHTLICLASMCFFVMHYRYMYRYVMCLKALC